MSLKGNLRHTPPPQLLNLINLAQRTGTLAVTGEEEIWLSFHRGKLVYASMDNGSRSLPQILWQTGRLSTRQMDTLRSHNHELTEKQLARLLVRSGYLTPEDITVSVHEYMLDTVSELVTWVEGEFDFAGNQLAPAHRIKVPVDLESLILDGGRQREERLRLQQALPNLDVYLRYSKKVNFHIYNIQLTLKEWRVVAASNARHTIRQIAQANKLTAYQVRRIVYGLLRLGLVEIVQTPQLMPVTA